MVKVQDLYASTRDGLDIILYYYPQAEGCIDNKKKFKRRPEEDDASACIKKYGECYKVTDFGDQGTAMSPIDICMYEENIKFPEAVSLLAARYGVLDGLSKAVNKPDIRKRPANAEEAEGSRFFELEEKFTKEQLAVLGPNVTQETVDALHWFVAKSVSYVKNREVVTKYTTPTYPIFMRQCMIDDKARKENAKLPASFYKIYEPLNPDKQWRFSYTPDGAKPKEYVNGLHELQTAYRLFNEQEERIFASDPANEGKFYKPKKLDEAFICSGERDSLCVRALGYQPLWFNSETYKVSPEEIKEIYKYVEKLYNIPDIDDTGRKKGTELALRFLDIYTVWLPSWLGHHRDRRGKPRKDFRDYSEIRPSGQDFRNLLALAMPARFWTENWSERSKRMTYEINISYLHHFLTLNGFYTLHDEDSDNVRYVRIVGGVVTEIKPKDIMGFLKQFAVERYLPVDIRNLILNSPRTGESSMAQLDETAPDFTSCDPHMQLLYVKGFCWKVTAEGIEVFRGGTTDGRVTWDKNVIDHAPKLQQSPFRWSKRTRTDGTDRYDIEVLNTESNFFAYLINTSRTRWREELEYRWAGKPADERQAYAEKHRFDLCGPMLTPDEQEEQKQNLLNKIFTIGYLMHRYKSPSKAWGVYAMDNKIGENEDQCNGRSGKSFFFKAFHNFMKMVKLDGRNPKLLDNPHVFDQVDRYSDILFVDDCDRRFPFRFFYSMITDGMTVNPKNNRSFTLTYQESPKICFSSNYVPTDFDSSSTARILYMVFSDYYHEKSPENDYMETRGIHDDFGKDLMREPDYTEQDWDADINFFARCLEFYLKVSAEGAKIQPPMDNIFIRKRKADMGNSFEDWAYGYFSAEGENLDVLLVRDTVYDDFIQSSKSRREFWTTQRFNKALEAFAEIAPHVNAINPKEMLNSTGRLQRKVEGKTRDMVYMQSKAHANEADLLDVKVGNSGDEVPF